MSNYKIRVNSKAESKEAQQLFFELGYNWFKKGYVEVETPETIMSFENWALSTGIRGSINHKEITLPELRDMVVLKRNDVGDATHYTRGSLGACLFKNYVGEKTYAWHKKVWQEQPTAPYLLHPISDLKPIDKKEMKEYLRKNSNGTYSYIGMVQPENISQNVIEIPEGSETFNYYDRKDNLFFLKGSGEDTMFSNDLNDWEWKKWGDIDFDGVVCLWQRHTLPEELPFIDDEPLQSLNDQYAEIEKVRQSAWQKQEGGSHYKNLKIQPMQYALENKLDYAQANVVKYVTRHKEKNGKEDLLKAIHNIELMIEFYYGGGE